MSIVTHLQETQQAVLCFFNSHQLPLIKKVSQEGEILEGGIQKGEYMGIEVTVYPNGKTKFQFSPHKFHNSLRWSGSGPITNHDTFTYSDFESVLQWLQETFSLQPNHCTVHHIEIGVNLQGMKIPTSTILDSLISYKGYPFAPMQNIIGNGDGREIRISNSRIKIYDKGLQAGGLQNIVRWELKAYKMGDVKNIFGRIVRLSDLLKPEIWFKCSEQLIRIVDLCVFDDHFNNIVETSNAEKLAAWRNPRYWKMPLDDNKTDTQKRKRERRRFEKLIEQHGVHRVKQAIQEGIVKEATQMFVRNNKGVMN